MWLIYIKLIFNFPNITSLYWVTTICKSLIFFIIVDPWPSSVVELMCPLHVFSICPYTLCSISSLKQTVWRFSWVYVDLNNPRVYFHAYICLRTDSQHTGVRGHEKFKGWLSLFIKQKGSLRRSVKDAPSVNHVYIAPICLTTACQSAVFPSWWPIWVSFPLPALCLTVFDMSEWRALFAPPVVAHLTKAPHLHESLSRHC